MGAAYIARQGYEQYRRAKNMPNDPAAPGDLAAQLREICPQVVGLAGEIQALRADLGLTRGPDGRPIFKTEWVQEEASLCLYVGTVMVADINAITFFARTSWHLRFLLPTLRPWTASGQKFDRLTDAKAEADARVVEFLDGIWRNRSNG